MYKSSSNVLLSLQPLESHGLNPAFFQYFPNPPTLPRSASGTGGQRGPREQQGPDTRTDITHASGSSFARRTF